MCASSRRPASERARRAAAPLAGVAVIVALVAATAAAAARPVVVRFAAGAVAPPGGERFLRDDEAWVRRQPSPAAAPDAPPGGPADPAGPRRIAASSDESVGAGMAGRSLASLLRDRWLARGHLAATVTAASAVADTGAPLVLEVAPGPRFVVGAVSVAGEDFPGRERLLAATLPRAGEPVRAQRWDEAVDRLLRGAAEAGHPFASWVVRDARVDAGRGVLDVEATLFAGPRAVLGPQTSDLPGGRGDAFLRRASGLVPGRPYRESELARARERLLERGLWARIGEPRLYTAGGPDTVGVHWPVTPVARPNRFAAVLGLSRREEGGGSRLSGQAELLLPNLAGTGRRLETSWFDDGRDRSRFGFAYLEPLAFGTPLDLEGSLAHEVATDLYTRVSADLRARLGVVAAWGLELGLGWDRGTFPAGTWERTSRVRARAAFLRRRADPGRSGWSATAGLETARRQAVARADTTGAAGAVPAAGSVDRQTLYDLRGEGEVYLSPVLSLAARAVFEEVRGEGQEVPLSEQYRFGGARTVRGWREGEFRGERVAHGSLEFRIGRYSQSRLYTFWDIGYFRFRALASATGEPERRVVAEGTVRGFGLGLETRAAGGDVSLAVGLPGTWDFDQAKLHVSLLQSF